MSTTVSILLCITTCHSASVSIKDFGAKGDGVSDDIHALEKAMAAVNNSGIILLPGPGRYAVSRPVVLNGASLTLRGDGGHPPTCQTGSGLVALSDTNSTVIVVASGCVMCRVEGLFLGHASSSSSSSVQQCSAERFTAAQRRAKGGKRRPDPRADPAFSRALVTPTCGSSIVVAGAFSTTVTDVWISDVSRFLTATEMANTVTILDSIMYNAYGPCGICIGGGEKGKRVDIVQISRVTTNNVPNAGNRSVVWIDVQSGVNTVRLDNVGLLNGGTGIRMASAQDDPPGVTPGRSLFLFGNDVEIDFPCGNAIELLQGEDFQLSNSYVQGAGSDTLGPVPDPTKGAGP